MNDERSTCAKAALGEEGERLWRLSVNDLISEENGHHFFQGWHIGWGWGLDGSRTFLDFLSEHRMAGIGAVRYFADGKCEELDTPQEFRLVGTTPEEDARLEQEYFEHNRAAYAHLRELRLLPPNGENVGSQEINEYLASGADQTGPSDN